MRCRPRPDCAWPMCFMPATETCIRWCSTTSRFRARKKERSNSPFGFCVCAWIMAAPGNATKIADVLRFANANGLTVAPAGGGTKAGWGNAVSPDIELNMKCMSELREHAWQDMTCTVQAGCTWRAMQEQLQRHGQ